MYSIAVAEQFRGYISSASALLALGVAVSITTGTITWVHLLAVSMLQGVLFSFFMPARTAIVPQIVGKNMLTNAMALDAAAMSATTLVAPAIAGTLYAIIGPEGVYYLIAGLGLLAVIVSIYIPNIGGSLDRPPVPMLRDIKEGLDYIWKSPLVLVLLVMGLTTALLAMPFRFLLPVFVVDVYNREADALGLLVSIMGLGSLIGSLFIASIGRWRRGLLLLIGSFLSGIGLLLVSLIPMYFVAVGIMVVLGLGDAGRRTLNQALIMETVEDQYRGRVMSVFMMNFGLMPLGVLPAGIIAEYFGGQVAIGILAVALIVATALIFVTQKRLRDVM